MLAPPGRFFAEFLDSIYEGKPLRIIETGCMRDLGFMAEYGDGWSTINIARWLRDHQGTFESVDLDVNAIELAHAALEAEGLAKYCTFRLQDSIKFLSAQTWLDVAYLDSCDGLEHGLQEFRLAASAGARLVIMDDFSTKASFAFNEAKKLGWNVSAVDRYSVLRRP